MLFSYLSPSQDWVSWGLLVISTSFIVYPETQLRADSYLVSDKSFFDYWINPCFLLFQSIIESCSSWVSSRPDCITKYKMGFAYSGVSNSFPILTSLHKTHVLTDQNDHMQLFGLRPPSDHWGELLSNFSAQLRHITPIYSAWTEQTELCFWLLQIYFTGLSPRLKSSSLNWIVLKILSVYLVSGTMLRPLLNKFCLNSWIFLEIGFTVV